MADLWANMRILWDNSGFDDARLLATSEYPEASVEFLKDTRRSKPWTPQDTGRASIFIDMLGVKVCRALGLVSYNFGMDASVTLRGYANEPVQSLSAGGAVDKGDGLVGIPCTGHGYAAGDMIWISGTEHYDGKHTLPDQSLGSADEYVIDAVHQSESFAGVEITARVTQDFTMTELIWESWYGYGVGMYGDHGYGGALAPADLERMPRLIRTWFWDEFTAYRFWELAFDNGGDTGDYEFSLGRVFLGPYFEPINNFSYGWAFKRVDPSTVKRSDSGVKHVRTRQQYFAVTSDLTMLEKAEVFQELLPIAEVVGIRRDCILTLMPADPTIKFYGIYGRFTELPGFTQAHFRYWQSAISFEESV